MRRLGDMAGGIVVVAVVGLALAAGEAATAELVPLPGQPGDVEWPTVAWPEAEPSLRDPAALRATVAALEALGGAEVPQTRAVLVVQGGRLVVERYAPGFDRESRFVSWSVAKTVTQALIGVLVRTGRLDLDAPAGVPEWSEPGDPRAAITVRNMLHMSSGLANAEATAPPFGIRQGFTARMLFGVGALDAAHFAADTPLAHPPGTHWAYSTGTSVILGRILGRHVGRGRSDTLAFMRRELFGPIGMRTAVPEFDVQDTFLGGAFVWASARDWARFGLLYLRDGVWEGKRILPQGWVDFSRTRAPAENNLSYGAHLWLNIDPDGSGDARPRMVAAPESVFSAMGRGGQYVTVVPGKDLVVVRLGETPFELRRKLDGLVGELVACFPDLSELPN